MPTPTHPTTPPASGPLPGNLHLARVSISLGSNRFTGTLPPGWISATLERLDLSSNQLSGQLPAGWAAPAGLQGRGAMPRLTSLALAGNALSGGHTRLCDVAVAARIPAALPGHAGSWLAA